MKEDRKRTEKQTTIYKTLHKQIKGLNINPTKTRVNADAPGWLAVRDPLLTPVVLLLNDMNNI